MAPPVLDLPHGGVAGRAQPRTSSIAQLSERLRARQKVRVEVLSSTAKVLVKAYLILKDAWLSYATEGHLELMDAVRLRSATL